MASYLGKMPDVPSIMGFKICEASERKKRTANESGREGHSHKEGLEQRPTKHVKAGGSV
jgi:hypothetical protein